MFLFPFRWAFIWGKLLAENGPDYAVWVYPRCELCNSPADYSCLGVNWALWKHKRPMDPHKYLASEKIPIGPWSLLPCLLVKHWWLLDNFSYLILYCSGGVRWDTSSVEVLHGSLCHATPGFSCHLTRYHPCMLFLGRRGTHLYLYLYT